MKRLRNWLRQIDEVLHEAFKLARSIAAILAVLTVEALGLVKLWAMMKGQ